MQQQAQKQVQPDDTAELRRAKREDFIAGLTDWAGVTAQPLQEDTSVRRFFRLAKNGKTAILMDARPPLEDTTTFELMQKKLKLIGLTVPEIYAADHAAGLVLMEDFGDIRFYELITQGKGDLRELYTLAVDALVHKAFADPKIALEQSAAYSDEYWLLRVEQFLQYYMPQVLGRTATKTERDDFVGLYHEAITAAHQFNDVLLHGDYGAQNIYHLSDRPGVKALGMIDFQDMTDARGNMMGSPAFDLSFLLQDVRVELPAALEQELRHRFVERAGIKDAHAFDAEYATIGAAQATKCLGLFARFGHVNKRPEYLKFIPLCLGNLERNLAHPELKGIRNWFIKNNIDIKR